MAIEFTTKVAWPAPLKRVLAMVTNPDYVLQRMVRTGYEQPKLVVSEIDATSVRFVSEALTKPSIPVPALAKKFVSDDQQITLTQTDTWDLTNATGTMSLSSVSAVSIQATMVLTESAGVTTNTLTWRVECHVPLVGNKLAALIAQDLKEKAALTARVSQELLNEQF